jgi:hypothetical protein
MDQKHDHDNGLFSTGHAPKASDAQAHEFFGYDSQQDLIDAYKRDNAEHGKALEKPVQDTVADADKYAHGKNRGK